MRISGLGKVIGKPPLGPQPTLTIVTPIPTILEFQEAVEITINASDAGKIRYSGAGYSETVDVPAGNSTITLIPNDPEEEYFPIGIYTAGFIQLELIAKPDPHFDGSGNLKAGPGWYYTTSDPLDVNGFEIIKPFPPELLEGCDAWTDYLGFCPTGHYTSNSIQWDNRNDKRYTHWVNTIRPDNRNDDLRIRDMFTGNEMPVGTTLVKQEIGETPLQQAWKSVSLENDLYTISTEDYFGPSLGLDNSGLLIVVYRRDDGSPGFIVRANRPVEIRKNIQVYLEERSIGQTQFATSIRSISFGITNNVYDPDFFFGLTYLTWTERFGRFHQGVLTNTQGESKIGDDYFGPGLHSLECIYRRASGSGSHQCGFLSSSIQNSSLFDDGSFNVRQSSIFNGIGDVSFKDRNLRQEVNNLNYFGSTQCFNWFSPDFYCIYVSNGNEKENHWDYEWDPFPVANGSDTEKSSGANNAPQNPRITVYEIITFAGARSEENKDKILNYVAKKWGPYFKVSGAFFNVPITVDATAKTFTRTDGGSFLTDGVQNNDTVRFGLLTLDSPNSDDHIVTMVTADTITCSGSTGLINEGPTETHYTIDNPSDTANTPALLR
jgi:hypothetical protein